MSAEAKERPPPTGDQCATAQRPRTRELFSSTLSAATTEQSASASKQVNRDEDTNEYIDLRTLRHAQDTLKTPKTRQQICNATQTHYTKAQRRHQHSTREGGRWQTTTRCDVDAELELQHAMNLEALQTITQG